MTYRRHLGGAAGQAAPGCAPLPASSHARARVPAQARANGPGTKD